MDRVITKRMFIFQIFAKPKNTFILTKKCRSTDVMKLNEKDRTNKMIKDNTKYILFA